MDILNWLYLAKNKFVRTTPGSLSDLMIFGAKVGVNKRGDLYQNYAMEIGEFAQILPAGPAGPQGVAGVTGPAGPVGPVGPAGLNWQGSWSALGTYVIDDAVGYGGASWFCIANVGPSATNPASDPTNWALLASQGATGATGATGLQGPTGATGPSGATNSLTTTGTGGAATLGGGVINIPVYQTQIPHLEYNLTDKTVWNNGLGNVVSSTSFGQFALSTANIFNFENSAFGAYSLSNISQGYGNTAVGYTALYTATTGNQNTAIGKGALYSNTANQNTAAGYSALNSNNSGTENTAIGHNSLTSNISGSYNTAVGKNALTSNTLSSGNTAVGQNSLASNTGANNVAVGLSSMLNLGGGQQNTAIGAFANQASTAGLANTAVGYNALGNDVTGSSNSALGHATASGGFTGSVILGANATATASYQFVVGSAAVNAGTVTTETPATADRTWLVRINGANYKIPMVLIP